MAQIKTRFYPSETAADSAMRRWNRSAIDHGRSHLAVLVDGPGGEAAVLPLREAIDNGFAYTWGA